MPSTSTPVSRTSSAPLTLSPPAHGECLTCADWANRGHSKDGTYSLQLWDSAAQTHVPVTAYCDMTRGGLTVFQQRADESVSFSRLWIKYKNGFGNVVANGSFWLGNDALHLLTATCGARNLRVDMAQCDRNSAYETYANFQKTINPSYLISLQAVIEIGSEAELYKVSLSGAGGTAGQVTLRVNGGVDGSSFSTLDSDNDRYDGSCSTLYGSGG